MEIVGIILIVIGTIIISFLLLSKIKKLEKKLLVLEVKTKRIKVLEGFLVLSKKEGDEILDGDLLIGREDGKLIIADVVKGNKEYYLKNNKTK